MDGAIQIFIQIYLNKYLFRDLFRHLVMHSSGVIGKFGVLQENLSNFLNSSPDIQRYSDVCRYPDVHFGSIQIFGYFVSWGGFG